MEVNLLQLLSFATEAPVFGALRYEIFTLKLKWVPGDPSLKVELDQLDPTAIHIGIYNAAGRLDAYARLIQGGTPGGLLLQQPEFAPLLPANLPVDASTGEVSRLCVRPQNPLLGVCAADLELVRQLIRAIYDLGCQRNMKIVYATTNDLPGGYINRAFLERLSFKVITKPHQFTPGVNTYLMSVDVREMSAAPFVQRYLRL